jgi:hypothetical protein
MRHNQITITYPQNATDLRTELFALKNQHGLNVSHFCRMWIEKGIVEYKTGADAGVSK